MEYEDGRRGVGVFLRVDWLASTTRALGPKPSITQGWDSLLGRLCQLSCVPWAT